MKVLIIVGFLAAVASAGRLGYEYGPGISSSASNGLSISSGSFNSGLNGASNGALIGAYTTSENSFGSGSSSGASSEFASGANYGSSSGALISSGSSSGVAQINIGLEALDSIPQTVEYSKQFFHYSAPEEQHEEGKIQRQLSNVLKKNLQVVFIKAPENNAATNAALQLAKQAIEQKTAIYVLSKQADGAQLVGQLQQIQESVPTKPEVKFVKYRTPEDLARAKQEIKQQYENTGGSSENINGGIAPVLNYASPASSSSGSQFLEGSAFSSGAPQLVAGNSFGSGSSQLIAGSSVGSGSTLGSSQLIAENSFGLGSNLESTQSIDGSSFSSGSALEGGSFGAGQNSSSGLSQFTSGSSSSNYLPPFRK